MKPRRLVSSVLIPIFIAAFGCAHSLRDDEPPDRAIELSEHVFIVPVGGGVWRHISHSYYAGYGWFPSNGLLIEGTGGLLMIDTAWGEDSAREVLDWAETRGGVQALIVTHAHEDRNGGLEEVHRRGIPSYGLEATSTLGVAAGVPPLSNPFERKLSLQPFGVEGEAYFPGPGHSQDNIVVWLSEPKLLFGGCMVRERSATHLGNAVAADLDAWPRAIARLQARYRHAEIVVPGHGEPGGPDILDHPQALFEKAK